MHRLAIFASGSGTNAHRIMTYFGAQKDIEVVLIISDKKEPGVKQYALEHKVDFKYLPYAQMKEESTTLSLLHEYDVDFIILAGYMRLIPKCLVREYHNKILNIHPALLPKFGGKGMYGMKVHEAVKKAEETETGVTIHLVNDKYDDGQVLFQKATPIRNNDSVEEIAHKVLTLEHKYFPKVIHSWILDHYSSSSLD